MAEFDVGPSSIVAAGDRVRGSGERIVEVSSEIAMLASAAQATGHPEPAAAYDEMCGTWNRELFAIGGSIAGLGGATVWAGELYEATDNAISSLFSGGSSG